MSAPLNKKVTETTPGELDAYALRKDFPILGTERNGKPLVYLDSGASTQKPKQVLDAITNFYQEDYANIHRGVYELSQRATQLYEKARFKVANFLNTPCARSVIFTSGTTESINLVASTWGKANIGEGDEILLTQLEHHSNLVPWQMLAQETGAVIRFIPLNEDATLDLTNLDELLTKRTKLVAVAHMSNVTGSIHPVKYLTECAHKVGALILIDGAQGACHLPVDIKDIDCDFYAFSAHKLCGPTGVGVLYGREEILNEMPPYKGGGDMIEMVYDTHFTTAQLPAKYEAGTPNIAGVIGLAAAIDYVSTIGLDKIHTYEQKLTEYAIKRLDDFGLVKQYGPRDMEVRGGICSFTFEKVHPHDVGTILDEQAVCIRAGHHCAQPFMRLCGISGTNRASFYFYNTTEDIDRLLEALENVKGIFRNVIK